MIETHKLVIRYFIWFFSLIACGYLLGYITQYFMVVCFLASLVVPTDQVRRLMVREYENVPAPRQAWLLIFTLSILPFCFGVYTLSVSELPEGVHRANNVVMGMFFWGAFTFGLNALLYRNNQMWQRARLRLTKAGT